MRQVISHNDAVEAGVVLEAFLKGTPLPQNVDRGAVQRVHDALLGAMLADGEHSSVVVMTEPS